MKQENCLKYFSHDACSVCKVLFPKVKQLLEEDFPMMELIFIDLEKRPEEAARHQVFTAPTLLVFFEGKEYYRFARNVSLPQLKTAIERPYQLLFQP
ncbi:MULTISPECIES: thioredoxin family protein [unclassified Carboxylicivirga]|uniref:thioredoxin family protein n=1 Tax=Carboxylicivirga TaxID=1628153 RepID=UPI003D331D1C